MDDVLVHDATEKDDLKHLQMIFEKIRKAGLKVKLIKYVFFKGHLQYSF